MQAQPRITASIIIPTFAVDRQPQVRWSTPAAHKQNQASSFRLSTARNSSSMINDMKKIERAASTSLPELPLNLQRTHI